MTEKDPLADLAMDTEATEKLEAELNSPELMAELDKMQAELNSPERIAELDKMQAELMAAIDSLDADMRKALEGGDWSEAAGLREKKAYLSGPELEKLRQKRSQAELEGQKAAIEDLRNRAAELMKSVAARDKMTAKARAIIEREEGISFSWLQDLKTARQRHPHWTNQFKPANVSWQVQIKTYMSNSAKDLAEATSLEAQASRLEKQMATETQSEG